MSRKGSYSGGSTIVHQGSSWFSRPQPDVDPESGETLEERTKRLAAEEKRRKEKREKQAKIIRKPPINVSKKRAKEIEKLRQKKVEKNRARLAEQDVETPKPRSRNSKRAELMSQIVIEKKRKKKLIDPVSASNRPLWRGE